MGCRVSVAYQTAEDELVARYSKDGDDCHGSCVKFIVKIPTTNTDTRNRRGGFKQGLTSYAERVVPDQHAQATKLYAVCNGQLTRGSMLSLHIISTPCMPS